MRPEARRLLSAAREQDVPFGVLTNDLSAFHDQIERQRFLAEIDALLDCLADGVLEPDPRAGRSGAAALTAALGGLPQAPKPAE